MHSLEQHHGVSEGWGIPLGGLVWPRPYFPTRAERALVISQNLPGWAIAGAHTAGWVWTGMGYPTPWAVLRQEYPGLSPLERSSWRARLHSPRHQRVEQLGPLRVLDPQSCATDILLHTTNIDAGATQLLFLLASDSSPIALLEGRRASAAQHQHAQKICERWRWLRKTYPDITR